MIHSQPNAIDGDGFLIWQSLTMEAGSWSELAPDSRTVTPLADGRERIEMEFTLDDQNLFPVPGIMLPEFGTGLAPD